ncbi:beta-galactosidase [soil metagenome]
MSGGVRFGASYYPPHHDPSDWARDMDLMAGHGLTVVRSAELLASWDRIEVARGRWEFEWLDILFDLAAERGMQVLLGTGTCAPPVWMAEEWPDLQVVSREGVQYPIASSWSWACKDHPGYLAEVERWIGQLAERYGHRPELLGWQIDNEPGHPFVQREGRSAEMYCYCAHTEDRFRAWLEERYGTPEALSDAWRWDPTNHRYSAWSQVRAPRSTPLEWGVVTAYLDWRRFIAGRVAEFVGWQHHMLKAATPDLPTMTNVFIWSRHDPFGVRIAQDPWRLAPEVDAIGYDLYPGIQNRETEHPEYVGMYLDYARSSAIAHGRRFWLPEIESGPINGFILGPDRWTDADDIRRLNVDGIGAGAEVILYQGYREWDCIPIHWGALADLEGRPTERLDAAADATRAAAESPDLMLEARAGRAPVAFLYDFDVGAVCTGMGALEMLLDAISGAYRAIAGAGHEVEFVSFRELDSLDCRLLVLPFTVLLPAEAATAIDAFVKRGGQALAFAKVAMLDGRGWYWHRRPGGGLDEVFGAREARIDVLHGPIPVDVPAHPSLPGWSGGVVQGAWHRQTLEVSTAEVLGRFADGAPALTVREHGLGKAWLAGTHLDVSVTRHRDRVTSQLLAAIARAAAGMPLFTAHPGSDGLPRSWARLRRSGREGVLTLTTTDPGGASVTVHVGADRARDLLTGESLETSAHRLIIHVPPMGARLIHLEGTDA